MPIYEYKCENEHRFEAFQAMVDDSLDVCEVCGAPAQRVLSAPAVHFKGSGFYTTDYARKGKQGGSSEGGGSESKGDSKGEGSKPEKKADSASGKAETKTASTSKE